MNIIRIIAIILPGILTALSASATGSSRWEIWSTHPADAWEDAFVTGNGSTGTIVRGVPCTERITCVHEQLFVRGWDRKMVTIPETAGLMPEVRRLILEGCNDEADSLITSTADSQLRDMGALQRWPLIPHPACDLVIETTHPEDKSYHYRRALNLAQGIATVEYPDGMTERVFSSRADDINVISLRSGRSRKLDLSLRLEETPGRNGNHFEHTLDSAFRSVHTGATDSGLLTFRADYRYDDGGYAATARVVTKGGEMKAIAGTLRIVGADEVIILMDITPYASSASFTGGCDRLSSLPDSFEDLLRRHEPVHHEMFRRMTLDLGCAGQWASVPVERMLSQIDSIGVTPLFIEQIHAMGRYLLISSCGKYPPPLQGIWSGGWKPMWIGGFVWDSNINLAVSAASMSNLPECAESYSRYVGSLLPGWRLNARRCLGCRGFLVAHYNDPETGYISHFGRSFPWMCWAGGAGWNIRPLYEQALFEGNDTMMHDRVLPLYREMADFYEDFLMSGSDSLLHIVPSISPENAPNGNDTWLSRDATMDVAVARDVFSILSELGEKFSLPEDEQARYSYVLGHLPPYRINGDGALAEWVDPTYGDVYDHRHISHLYPVFPATQISRYHGDPLLADAAREALQHRFMFDTGSAHGLIHLALQAARLGDTDKIADNLDRFCRREYVYRSLITSHDPHHNVYNLDAVLSLPRLFMEMLVYTEDGFISLLPAWPEGFPDGNLSGVKLIGGHTLDLSWRDGKPVKAILTAGSDNKEFTVRHDGVDLTFNIRQGCTYNIISDI